jgi:hypothetical protein
VVNDTRSAGLEMLKGLENAHAIRWNGSEPILAVPGGPNASQTPARIRGLAYLLERSTAAWRFGG